MFDAMCVHTYSSVHDVHAVRPVAKGAKGRLKVPLQCDLINAANRWNTNQYNLTIIIQLLSGVVTVFLCNIKSSADSTFEMRNHDKKTEKLYENKTFAR